MVIEKYSWHDTTIGQIILIFINNLCTIREREMHGQ